MDVVWKGESGEECSWRIFCWPLGAKSSFSCATKHDLSLGRGTGGAVLWWLLQWD